MDKVIIDKKLLNLGISASAKKWYLQTTNDYQADMISQKCNLDINLAKIIESRGISHIDVDLYLNPSVKNCLTDPRTFKDMDKLTSLICDAIINNLTVGIFGDYDVDGATSTAVLMNYFKHFNVPCHFIIPNRIDDGYGPNKNAFDIFKQKECDLIICVDCATTAFDVLQYAHDIGLKVAVIDHHMSETKLPKSQAIVNPNRFDENGELSMLAAVGVVFFCLVSVNRELRSNFSFMEKLGDLRLPNLLDFLDMVALGTVCDLVPLTKINRAFVKQGLVVLAKRNREGLKCLADISSISSKVDTYHLGYLLGPRINAAGRIGDCTLGVKLLTTEDAKDAEDIAIELDNLNKLRQQMNDQAMLEAVDKVEKGIGVFENFICLSSDNWHEGIIGIIAGRIKELYNKPTIIISFASKLETEKDIDEYGKGSGRSVNGIDLGSMIILARQSGILSTGGGHKMAVGLSIKRDNLEKFSEFMNMHIGRILQSTKVENCLTIDAQISLSGLNLELCKKLEILQPFGMGNFEPTFAFSGVLITSAKIVGEKHISLYFKTPLGGAKGVKAICFSCIGTPLGDKILSCVNSRSIAVAGKVKLDTWLGVEKVQIIVKDICTAN